MLRKLIFLLFPLKKLTESNNLLSKGKIHIPVTNSFSGQKLGLKPMEKTSEANEEEKPTTKMLVSESLKEMVVYSIRQKFMLEHLIETVYESRIFEFANANTSGSNIKIGNSTLCYDPSEDFNNLNECRATEVPAVFEFINFTPPTSDHHTFSLYVVTDTKDKMCVAHNYPNKTLNFKVCDSGDEKQKWTQLKNVKDEEEEKKLEIRERERKRGYLGEEKENEDKNKSNVLKPEGEKKNEDKKNDQAIAGNDGQNKLMASSSNNFNLRSSQLVASSKKTSKNDSVINDLADELISLNKDRKKEKDNNANVEYDLYGNPYVKVKGVVDLTKGNVTFKPEKPSEE